MARKTPNIELPPDKERLVDQKKRQPYGVRSEEELIKKLSVLLQNVNKNGSPAKACGCNILNSVIFRSS